MNYIDASENSLRSVTIPVMDNTKLYGEIFTPPHLASEMLSHLPEDVWTNPNLKWIDPSCGKGEFLIQIANKLQNTLECITDPEERYNHIRNNMIYGVEIQQCHVDEIPYPNIQCADALTFDFWDLQFDIIVGNPPYQDDKKAQGKLGSKPLWVRFVNLVLDKLLKPEGYLCFIHPSKWRKFKDELWNKMTSKQIHHLDIHGYKDGQKTFGCSTRYDWYILQNTPYTKPTFIRDEEGIIREIDIRDWQFLPNFAYDEIQGLLGEGTDILYSRSKHGTDKKWMNILHSYGTHEIRKESMNKDAEGDFIYPCVYSINRKNEPKFYYCNQKSEHFGTPKVIFGSGATGFIVDKDGEYGLTQFATGIVDDPENLEQIAEVLNSKKFKRIIEATSMSKAEIDRKILGLFRKDFWREFTDE